MTKAKCPQCGNDDVDELEVDDEEGTVTCLLCQYEFVPWQGMHG